MAKILITGTSKGIGYDASLFLANGGHNVIATMRNPNNSDLGEVAAKDSLPIDIHPMDVDDSVSITSVFDTVGQIDVLVNNAGILSNNAIEDEPLDVFTAVMNTNYLGLVRCCKAVIPRMRENRKGCIINIGSVAGKIAISPSAAYASSKHAVEAFSEVLAQEMFGYGVKVYLVEPGIIDTPMSTTEWPVPDPDSVYPNGNRMNALMKFAAQGEAPPILVSEKIRELVEEPPRPAPRRDAGRCGTPSAARVQEPHCGLRGCPESRPRISPLRWQSGTPPARYRRRCPRRAPGADARAGRSPRGTRSASAPSRPRPQP